MLEKFVKEGLEEVLDSFLTLKEGMSPAFKPFLTGKVKLLDDTFYDLEDFDEWYEMERNKANIYFWFDDEVTGAHVEVVTSFGSNLVYYRLTSEVGAVSYGLKFLKE
jgi:hypothetical protein